MNERRDGNAELRRRYLSAAHAIQSATAYLMELAGQRGDAGMAGASPKHLRVGVNMAMVDTGAMAQLLIRKGLITDEEYMGVVVERAEAEVVRLTAEARDLSGLANLTFG